eukprot:s2944_g8.t1
MKGFCMLVVLLACAHADDRDCTYALLPPGFDLSDKLLVPQAQVPICTTTTTTSSTTSTSSTTTSATTTSSTSSSGTSTTSSLSTSTVSTFTSTSSSTSQTSSATATRPATDVTHGPLQGLCCWKLRRPGRRARQNLGDRLLGPQRH